MAPQDVVVHYDDLTTLNNSLKDIIAEFEQAGDRESDLQTAIGKPFGKSDLSDKAGDFESNWDIHRKKLLGDLQTVQQHVQGVLDGFQNWDTKTGNQIANQTSGGTTGQPAPTH